MEAWLTENWFTLLQSTGIIGSLWYAGRSFRFDARVRRAATYIEIVGHHREIWAQLYSRPELARVRMANARLDEKPVTVEEDLFVSLIILHLSGVYRASKDGIIESLDGARTDLRRFFSRPIPMAVWRKKRAFQDRNFVEYLEEILHDL